MGGPTLGRPLTGSPGPSRRHASVPIRSGSIGILGGTFDPFHLGHLGLGRAARDELGLERVLVVPAAASPFKVGRPASPAEDRLAMIEAGIAGEDRLETSRLELDRPAPSYTVDTLEAIAAAEQEAGRDPDLTLIVSAEVLDDLAAWRSPERVVELARLAVAARPGHPIPDAAELRDLIGDLAVELVPLKAPLVDVSASVIRRRVVAGQPIDDLVPTAVAAYIARHRLYRQDEPEEDPSIVTEPAGATPSPTTAPRPDGLPSRESAAPAGERPPLDVARRIVELAEDKKAADIVLLDLAGLTTLADAFVICSGGSERQLDAIADGIVEGLRAEKIRPIGREGTAASHWVLVDFGSVVVHVFTPPERDYYSLEKHWSEARTVLRVQ
jgi:nicotinate-nucleotide adenylyltransferase